MASESGVVWEILRKLIHLSSILILFGYTIILKNTGSPQTAILALTGLLLLFLEIEQIRLEHRPKIAQVFNLLFRSHERAHVVSAVFIVISTIICFSAFDYPIAVVALLMTIFGDIFAAVIGKAFGKHKIFRNKTVVGTLAGFAANLIAGILVLPDFYYLVIPMAITASVVELFTNKLSDNLTVPVFTGFVGQMLVYFLAIELPLVQFFFIF